MPSVGPMSAGFKQVPVGSYLTILSTINKTNVLKEPVKSGSGGAHTVAAPAAYSWPAVDLSSLMGVGNLLKDMGTSQVSSGRVFRKFKAVARAGASGGDLAGDSNFGTFYLEVAADGGDVPLAEKATLLARSF